MYKDTIMPYVMASMHPLMHLTFLITSTFFYLTNKDEFLKVPNANNCTDKLALHFIGNTTTNTGGDKERLVKLMMFAHTLGILFHWLG
jgi:hypothetical protein